MNKSEIEYNLIEVEKGNRRYGQYIINHILEIEKERNNYIKEIERLNNIIDELKTENLYLRASRDFKQDILRIKSNIIQEAILYNNHLIKHAKYHLNLGHLKKMSKILEGVNEGEKTKEN